MLTRKVVDRWFLSSGGDMVHHGFYAGHDRATDLRVGRIGEGDGVRYSYVFDISRRQQEAVDSPR